MALADINGEAASSAAKSLGSGAIAIQMDITQQSSIDKGFATAVEQLGKLDILVNNAALFTAAPIVEITREDYDRVFAVNTAGTIFCTQAAAKHMIAGGRAAR